MRLLNFLTRWHKPPNPGSMPAPEPRPLPLNLQVSFASFEARLNALQNDYLTLVDAVFENHSKDRIELRRREEAVDRLDERIAQLAAETAQLAAETAQLQQSSLETFQKLLKAIAEISATVDREIAKQRTTAESAPCAAQAHPDGAQVLESPDPAQNLPPASGSETYSDGAASGSPAVDDSPA